MINFTFSAKKQDFLTKTFIFLVKKPAENTMKPNSSKRFKPTKEI